MLSRKFPVALLMERRQIQQGYWILPHWQLLGVIAGNSLAGKDLGRVAVHSENNCEQFLWTGFGLRLFKDSAESYWYNLVGKTPSLFVVCRTDTKYELAPFIVTADYDEAASHMEADDTVFSAPMPPEIYPWLEQYVVANYQPREKKKRKRKSWLEESKYGKGRPKIQQNRG